ncbi:MAG TPA: hypothetical protein VFR84_04820 [Candidatus Angelobacter sp.]|nr:hypothetical protein [Candidatus Angelobacter sp.]
MRIRTVRIAMIVLAGAGACAAQKANDWAFQNAMIGPDSPIEMNAGSTYQAQVVYPVPDGPLYPLKAKVTWRIEPAVKGIAIDASSGKITVQAEVAHGSSATVRANVDNGRRTLTAKLWVFRAEMYPFIGSWMIESEPTCGDMTELKALDQPGRRIAGLTWKFHVDEQFWIGRELGIAAGTFLSGRFENDTKNHKLTLLPEWPKGRKSSTWTWSVVENGKKLLLRPETSAPSCSYALHRQ